MRKRHWSFAVVVLAAGVGWAGYYSYRHPDSVVVQCASRVCALVNQGNPVVTMVQGAVVALRPEEKSPCCRHGADNPEECVPDEPLPSDPEPAAEPKRLGSALALNPVGRVPAPIVIPDEEPIVQAGAQALTPDGGHEPEGEAPMTPAAQQTPPPPKDDGEAGDESHSCPRVMPYCPEDESNKPMPYASADEEKKDVRLKEAIQSFQKLIEESREQQTGSGEEAEVRDNRSAENEPSRPAAYEQSPEPAARTDSSEDSHPYHQRYSVCPYSGKCVELPEPTAEPGPEKIPAPGLEEQEPREKEQPAKMGRKGKKSKVRSHKASFQGGLSPTRSDIDTMEFRPSDHNLNEFTGGPY